ncbi:hypothetical protein pipiens_007632 [Culex pipiens pipiens]|uniref:Uncharacterized protein n=1 Tax=Culex pipiens pipiens TaxID=38569 RepID=A0ABD1DKW9_CULPP
MIKPSSSKRKADFDDERGERASKVLVVEIESTGDQNGQKRDMIDMVEEEEWIDEEVNSAATLNLNNCIIHEAHLHEEKSTKNRSKSRLFKLSNQYDVKQSSITDHFTRLTAEDKQKSVGNIPSYDVLAEDDKNKKRNKFIEMLLEICEKQQKGGRLNYNTYMSLLPLPSKSTIYQYYSKQMADVPEGVLRTKELVTYIEENNLSPYVFLSEDATAITGRIEYDKKTNRIFGIVHEDDPITGMPVVRGTEVHGGLDIKKLLSSGKQATDVNIMYTLAESLRTVCWTLERCCDLETR